MTTAKSKAKKTTKSASPKSGARSVSATSKVRRASPAKKAKSGPRKVIAAKKSATSTAKKSVTAKKAAPKRSAKTSARSSSRRSPAATRSPRSTTQNPELTSANNTSDESSVEGPRGDFPLSFASKSNPRDPRKNDQEPAEADRADKIKSSEAMRRQPGTHGSRSW